jgi:glycosidase
MTGASDPDNRRMMRFDNELNQNEKQTFQDVSRLIHIRDDHPALRYGDFYTLEADNNIYAYLRSDMNERILVILNKDEKQHEVKLNLPSFYNLRRAKNLVTNEYFQVNENKISSTLNGISYLILKLN